MYCKFLEAHGRAVALGGLTPELRADRAHGLHVFERKFEEAEAELLQARREEPSLATTYGHLAMLYATRRNLDEALDVLDEAYRADALWPALPATEVFVRLCRHEFDRATACGEKAVELHPYLPLGRLFYAEALEYSGRLEQALAQYRVACVMAPDLPWMRAHEAVCLAKSGRDEEARGILEELQQKRRTEYVDAYSVVPLLDALGRRDEAFRELDRAFEENSATLFVADVDVRMDPLRADSRFERFREKILGSTRAPALSSPVGVSAPSR
jgi:tetratricopeptide (TPR) repeat protein